MTALKVVVTLTPLSNPGDYTRYIELNSTKNKATIGRASKSETKGLLAERDNAWFDSPIMSRQHAILSMSVLPKRITLQDCGSTHGTYVSGHRLQPNDPHALKDWDVITFGAKVTSGADIYPAREFTVSFEWETRSSIPSVLPDTNASTGFQVPEEEPDSSSEVSVADSVQILDSHPRMYSVPSSDDGSVDEDDAYRAYNAKLSADMTKELGDISNAETQKAKSEHETVTPMHDVRTGTTSDQPSIEEPQSIGASHANPIDLDHGQRRHQCIEIESGSDDEGPDVLPMTQNPTTLPSQKPKLNIFHGAKVASQAVLIDQNEIRKKEHREHGEKTMETLRQQNLQQLRLRLADYQAPNTSNELESFDDWESDEVDDLNSDGSEDGSLLQSQPLGSPVNASEPRMHVSSGQGHPTMEYSLVQQHRMSENAVPKDKPGSNQDQDPVMRSSSIERAPSPSDAALAKKASFTETASDDLLPPKAATDVESYPGFSTLDSSRYASDPPVMPITTYSSRWPVPDRVRPWQTEESGKGSSHLESLTLSQYLVRNNERADEAAIHHEKILEDEERRDSEKCRKDEQSRLDQQRVASQKTRNRTNEIFPNSLSGRKGFSHGEESLLDFYEKAKEAPRPYDYGPFSTRIGFHSAEPTYDQDYVVQPSYHTTFHGNNPVEHQKRSTIPTYHGYPSGSYAPNVFDVEPPPSWNHCVYPEIQNHPRNESSNLSNMIRATHAPIASSPLRPNKETAHKMDEVQPARLPIADLLTLPMGTKRVGQKTETADLLTSSSGSKNLKRKANLLEADSETIQEKRVENGVPLTPESQQSDLPDAQTREELAAPAEYIITQTTQDSFVLEGKGSSQSQLEALAVQEIAGPARKKARTLSSKTGGIAKFVGGVCVGVVGVVAAFVATIPESVREEAMREVAKHN